MNNHFMNKKYRFKSTNIDNEFYPININLNNKKTIFEISKNSINFKKKKSLDKYLYFFSQTNKIINKNICINFLYVINNLNNNELLFEKTDGNLLDFIKFNDIDDDILISMIFQILFGIYIMHNSLLTLNMNINPNNIFYKKINNTEIKYFKYNVGMNSYLVPNYGYLFMIVNYDNAISIHNTNNIDIIDNIKFGIKYNLDFTYLANLYYIIVLNNIITKIDSINKLFELIKEKNHLEQLKKIIKIYKKQNNITDKIILDSVLIYCIQNDFININDSNIFNIKKNPNLIIKKLINNIFTSRDNISNIFINNFNIYSNNNKLSNNILSFGILNNKHSDIKLLRNLTTNNSNNNTFKQSINQIKIIYNFEKFNYSTSQYYFLNKNSNFLPKLIKPMYDNIEPFDYIQPIKYLYNRFPSEYYKNLIKHYDFEKSNKRLDLYKNIDKIDLDEIMLQYVKTRFNCYVITLWPIFSDYVDETIKYLESFGNVYYKKDIEFESRGLINYLCSVYDEFSNQDILKIAQNKYEWMQKSSTTKSNKISIIIFDNINELKLSGQAAEFKTIFRNWALNKIKESGINTKNIWTNDLLHINDYFYQTIEYCELILNNNSIKLLNNRLYEKIYSEFYSISHLKIETYRKTVYSNLSLETINSLFLIAGVTLFFYGIRPIDDLDGICINYNNQYKNQNDYISQDIKNIIKILCDSNTRIDYIEFGTTNTDFWKEKWTKNNSIIANYFDINNFNEICWNPRFHCYYKGIKNYIIDFEFYKKLQRTDAIIGQNIWPTLSKDYTDYIMINYLNSKIIENFIYIDSNGKLKIVDKLTKIYPKLDKLPFCSDTLQYIKKFLNIKYKIYLTDDFTDDYIKSFFNL